MRFASDVSPSGQVFAVAGTNTVSFAVVAPDSAQVGLLGYAVSRLDADYGDWQPMDGFKVFADVVPAPTPDLRVSTYDHPVQSFTWDDFLAKPGHAYEYRFQPVKGSPGMLTYQDPSISVGIRTEPLYGGTHDVFFNRGVASSQAYVRRFGRTPVLDLAPADFDEALAWLSRDLDDALLRFVDDCAPGDTLRGCFYEFRYDPAAAAFRRALDRGVDVRLIVDAKENSSTDKLGVFHEAFPKEDNLRTLDRHHISVDPADRLVVLRRARKSNIAHNKFMVRIPKGKAATEVWTGSTNLSLGGIAGQTNVGHWVRDADVAAAYLEYWSLLEGDPGGVTGQPDVRAKNAAFKSAVEALSPVVADLTTLATGTTAAFSPRPDTSLLESYARLLDGADKQACITLAFGVGAAIKNVLMDNTQDGPLEFLLLEKKDLPDSRKPEAFVRLNSSNNVYQAWGSFLKDPVYQWVRETNTEQLELNSHVMYIHSKFMLVDPLGHDPFVVTGSANFSAASTNENDENMLLIRGDRRVADIYYTEFNRLFNHYYFRSVVDDLSHRPASASSTSSSASRFLDPTDSWVGKYQPGSFRAKRLAIQASMSDVQTLPLGESTRPFAPVTEPTRHAPRRRANAFEVYVDHAGKHRWRLRSTNGQVVAVGQAYSSRRAAEKGVDAVRRACAAAAVERLD